MPKSKESRPMKVRGKVMDAVAQAIDETKSLTRAPPFVLTVNVIRVSIPTQVDIGGTNPCPLWCCGRSGLFLLLEEERKW